MPLLSGLSYGGLSNSNKATSLYRTSRELDAFKSIFEGCLRHWFGRDKPGTGNLVLMLLANNNQHIQDFGKVNMRGKWISFKLTESHKIQRMVTCQSILSITPLFVSIWDEKWIAFDNTHRGLMWLGSDQGQQFQKKKL